MQWTKEQQCVRDYLESYKLLRRQTKTLEQRRRDILADFQASPLSAVVSDGMPRGTSTHVGAASLALKLDGIDTKIVRQLARMKERLETIFALIDLLPEDSEERVILEQRILDNKPMEFVADNTSMARATGYRVYYKAIAQIADNPATWDIIKVETLDID